MNRKKRKASGSRATNSNQKHSTVPWNDAVEVLEMLAVDHIGTGVVDFDEDGEQLDYVEVAWLLREKLNDLGEKLNDFVEGGKGGQPGLELRNLLNMAASRKIVSVDSKKMSPVLWKNLPKELLLLVLTRLPLPDIPRLRSLSKEWSRDMITVNSEINRALDEASPTMVAGFSFTDFYCNSEFLVTICDLSNHRSPYTYLLHPGDPILHENRWDDMGARDGGLVCFVSTWEHTKANPLCIVVVNLLTRVQRKLPPLLYVHLTPPKMMHIEVDSETKCYRVVVIGKNRRGRPTVEIYHSGARQWTKATPSFGFIFGATYSRWQYWNHDRTFRSTSITRSVFDFAEGKLKGFDERAPSGGASVAAYELHKDCMYVLHRNTSTGENWITKYHVQNNLKGWVQEKSYKYFEGPLEDSPGSMTLKACENFLMVSTYSSEKFWILDLSTGEWSSLQKCFTAQVYGASILRASWNVVP